MFTHPLVSALGLSVSLLGWSVGASAQEAEPPTLPYLPATAMPASTDSMQQPAAAPPAYAAPNYDRAGYAQARENWLAECISRHSRKRAKMNDHVRGLCEDYLTRYETTAYNAPPPAPGGSAYPYYYPVPGGYPAYGYPSYSQGGAAYPPMILPPPGVTVPTYGAPMAGGYYGPVMLVPQWVQVPPPHRESVREEIVEQPAYRTPRRTKSVPGKRIRLKSQ